jgi:hypothetical protein
VVVVGVQREVVASRRWPMAALPVMVGTGVAVKGASAIDCSSCSVVGAVPSSVADGRSGPVDGATTRADDDAVTVAVVAAASAGAADGSTATSSATPRLSPVTPAMSRARADAMRIPRAAARRTAGWCSPM